MRWFRNRLLAIAAFSKVAFLAVSLVAPRPSFSDELSVGPLRAIAGGGFGEGAAAIAVGMTPTSVLATDDGLWVADEQFNRVRYVSADGTIRSVVGNGRYGFNGNGLPALRSHLGIVVDLAFGPQGRLFLVDLANRQIRWLDEEGALHTFVDADHPLFTSVDGRFAPASVAIGPAGKVHVTDRGTNVVWQFDADRQGRRVAGNGTRGFSGDGAPSVLGELADPRAVAVGADGAIWIADTGNGRVRVVAPNGRLSTVAAGLKPLDIAIGEQGQVFILDELGRQVLRLGPAPHFVDGNLVGADIRTVVYQADDDAATPSAIDVGTDGRLYVADHGRRHVLAVALDSGLTSVIAGNGTQRAAGDSSIGFSVRANTAMVLPGEDLTLAVTLRPVRRAAHTAILRVRTNDPLNPVQEIELTGAGGRAELSVTDIDLGVLPIGLRRRQELLLTNEGELDLRIDRILSGTRQLILTPRWLNVPAGSTRSVRIDFAPAVHGDVTGKLTLLTNDPAQPQWSIPYHGRGVSKWLDLSESEHDFGAVSGPTHWTLDVTNYRERRLTLLDVSTDNGAFRVIERPRRIESGESGAVIVEFHPPSVAVSAGQLLLHTDLAEAPDITVALRGGGRAAGRIYLEPTAERVSLWPDEELQVPVQVADGLGLRGAVLSIQPPPGFSLRGFDLPQASLLRLAGEPLVVTDAVEGSIQVGLSLTGADRPWRQWQRSVGGAPLPR